MATNDPTVSYGRSVLYTSSGATVDNGDEGQSYGQSSLFHEFVAATGLALPIIQVRDVHSTIFGGQVIN